MQFLNMDAVSVHINLGMEHWQAKYVVDTFG